MSIGIRIRSLPFPGQAAALLAVFLAASATPARAQQDPLLDARVNILDLRLNRLEPGVLSDHIALQDARARLGQAVKDIIALQQRLLAEELRTAALEKAVSGLLNRPPDAPDKPAPAPPAPGQPAASGGSTVRAPFTVKDSAGRILFTVDAAASGNNARAIVGDAAGNRVEIGPRTGGAAAITLFDESNATLATLVGDRKGSFLRVKDSDLSVMLGHAEPEGRGLFLRKDSKDILTLTPDKTGAGTVKVFGSSGSAVGAIYADDNGGQLVLTGPSGGKTAASVSVTPSGGKVRVFPVNGGTARAELAAKDASGVVNLFAGDGTNVASLSALDTGMGRLELTDNSGRIMVEAGTTKSQVGYLTTGPYDMGVAASMLSAGKPASSLLGSSKAK